MMYDCDICGCKGFKNPGGLASHKATSRACKLAGVCKKNTDMGPQREIEQTCDLEQQTADDFINLMDPLASKFSTPEANDVEDVMCTPFSEFCKGSKPKHRFDSTLRLVAFIRQCRNTMGLSVKDIRRLLGLLFHPKFCLDGITVKNASDLLKYEKQMARTHCTEWNQVIVRERDERVPELTLHYQDPIEALSLLFSNACNKEDFKLGPTRANSRGSYSTPDTGQWWSKMQDEIDKKCPGGVIAAVILYSDQTPLSNNQRVSGYPLMMSLANIACAGRREKFGNALLAILPTYGACDPDITNATNPTLLKSSLLHKCLSIVLAPLKELSYIGLPLEDPSGSQKWVFPLIYGYIGDHPETCKVTCTFDSNRCNFPCSVCLCPKDQLNAVALRHEYREEAQMKTIHREMISLPTNMTNEVSRLNSIHPVECALWDFFGGNTILGNPYRSVHPDKMHQFDLGLFKTFISILKAMAVEVPRVTFKHKALDILDKRMALVALNHRYPEFRLPACKGRTGYFTSNATFQAFEHRSVFQVIIPLLLGVYPTPVIINDYLPLVKKIAHPQTLKALVKGKLLLIRLYVQELVC